MPFGIDSLASHRFKYELNPRPIRVGICGRRSGTVSGFFSDHSGLILSVVIHPSSVILMTDNRPIKGALSLRHYIFNPVR